MTRLEALRALAEKVEAGDGETDYWWEVFDSRLARVSSQGAFYGSFDAAKALHEAVLAGWRVACIRQGDEQDTEYQDCEAGDWFVNLFSADFEAVSWAAGDEVGIDVLSGMKADAWSKDPARAWLLAIIRALIQEESR